MLGREQAAVFKRRHRQNVHNVLKPTKPTNLYSNKIELNLNNTVINVSVFHQLTNVPAVGIELAVTVLKQRSVCSEYNIINCQLDCTIYNAF